MTSLSCCGDLILTQQITVHTILSVHKGSTFFVKISPQNGLTIIDDRAFFNFTSAQPRNSNGEMFIFQPGDIIGRYIHSIFQSIDVPLSVVYGHATNNEWSAGVEPQWICT